LLNYTILYNKKKQYDKLDIMKTAFISDVHGNIEAFSAVCESIMHAHVDRIIFLGDIVGYGANPNECIEQLQTLTPLAVAGNHDWAAAGRQTTESFNIEAADVIEWTCAQLTTENKLFLMALPLILEMDELLCVHATPFMPDMWRYVFNTLDAEFVFDTCTQRICCIAHTHRPAIFVKLEDKMVVSELPAGVNIQSSSRYLINCGSVGQPRDGDPRASYGIYDAASNRYELVRVQYDVAAAQKKIRSAGLPDIFAHRICIGR
jgi:diadenosine tetraphosphatase ApaH/serine/threonine PP2A family protein phosphatase